MLQGGEFTNVLAEGETGSHSPQPAGPGPRTAALPSLCRPEPQAEPRWQTPSLSSGLQGQLNFQPSLVAPCESQEAQASHYHRATSIGQVYSFTNTLSRPTSGSWAGRAEGRGGHSVPAHTPIPAHSGAGSKGREAPSEGDRDTRKQALPAQDACTEVGTRVHTGGQRPQCHSDSVGA